MSLKRQPYVPVKEPADNLLSTKGWTQAEKNKVWAYVKANSPRDVSFLTDPAIRALLGEPDTYPAFDKQLIIAALGYLPGHAMPTTSAPTGRSAAYA